jgi:peptidyl-prolyl cis-trans isomerase SurA
MKQFLFLLFLVFSSQLFSQRAEDPVLLKIDDKKVTRSEFETIFKKNNKDTLITRDDLDEYMELFINFKLKVIEAEELGKDTLPSFVNELKGYRDQLAAPYLVDKSTTDSLLQQAYDRMQYEVRASHILVRVGPDASPEDTLKAYNKIVQIKKEVKKSPENFEEIAKEKSEDPSAESNGGDLGYFTSLQMVYPFENLVYNTPVGEIDGPVRTKFGYHIVKVSDKRSARGEVKVAHIMVRSEEGDPEDVQVSSKQRIDEVYQKLEEGEDFSELAKKYSDDRSSAAKGGTLPPFGAGKMVAEFEEAAFSIQNPGEIAGPVKSPYGWHIIKLIERIPLQSYDEMEKELERRIGRDSRSNLSKNSFIDARKKEYGFVEDKRQLKPFYAELDSTYFKGAWSPSTKLSEANEVLFTLDGNEYTQNDFLRYLQSRMRPRRADVDAESYVTDSYENFVTKSIMDYEDSKLEEKYPEFKALMNEYRDGILLFDLTDEKVWSKAVKDTTGLEAYYEANKDQFMWEERAEYEVYTVDDEETGKKVEKLLNKGKSMEAVKEKFSSDSALKLKVDTGLAQKDEVPVLSKVEWEEGVSDMINDEGQLKLVRIKEIREPEPKGFDEARGIITAAYQTKLEEDWVEELRAKHTIEVNREVLYTIK